METNQIWEVLTEVFREVFDDESLEPHPEMVAKDVDLWDSLSNIRMIVAIEQKMNFQFTAAEISDLANVGELVKVISKRAP